MTNEFKDRDGDSFQLCCSVHSPNPGRILLKMKKYIHKTAEHGHFCYNLVNLLLSR